MNGSDAVQGLQEMKAMMDKGDFKLSADDCKRYSEILAEASKCVGICFACQGRGVIYRTNRGNFGGGFAVRSLRGNKLAQIYEYPCPGCKGKGQRLLDRCSGCAQEYRPLARPDKRDIEMIFPAPMCPTCFNNLDARVGLIFDQKTEETKKLLTPVASQTVPTPVKPTPPQKPGKGK